jgi:glycosyltransferase involved in cell wall biosynthesis
MTKLGGNGLAVNWCTVAPMPYTDDLFRRLRSSAGSPASFTVYYLSESLSSYPMGDLGGGYERVVLKSWLSAVSLFWRAATRPRDRWLVGGWGAPKYAGLLTLLTLLGRDFLVFSDAPVPGGRTASKFRRSVRARLLRYWFGGARKIVATGDMAVDRFAAMGVDRDHIVSMPYPLDETRFEVGPDFDAASGEPLNIVCTSRLSIVDKQLDLAVEAFAAVCGSSETPVRLQIAGSGPDEDRIRAAVRKHGLDEHVEFLGWLSQDQLRELYRDGHIYLHPATFEPYGVTVVEALYSGLYTVASDGVGAGVELIEPLINGRLFRSGDLADLVQSLEQAVRQVTAGAASKHAVRSHSLRWDLATCEAKARQLLFS